LQRSHPCKLGQFGKQRARQVQANRLCTLPLNLFPAAQFVAELEEGLERLQITVAGRNMQAMPAMAFSTEACPGPWMAGSGRGEAKKAR
jgi:hypothetical protein